MQNSKVHRVLCLPVCLLLLLLNDARSLKCDEGSASCSPPSLPDTSYCQVSNAEFDVGSHTLRVYGKVGSTEPLCQAADAWQLVPERQDTNSLVCDQIFETGHFFKLERGGNMASLLINTLMPLLHAVYGPPVSEVADGTVLLPGIERAGGGKIDWDVEEFLDPLRPENQMIQGLAGPHSVLPLDKRLSAVNKTICFRKANFGTPTTNVSDPKLVSAFVSRLRGNLGLKIPKRRLGSKPQIGMVLNFEKMNKGISMPSWNEATKEISNFARVIAINYNKLSLKEQVSQTQGLDVLVVASADIEALMGALYLPPWGVTVLLAGCKAGQDRENVVHLLESSGRFIVRTIVPTPATGNNEVVHSDKEAAAAIVQVVRKAINLSRHQS
ncbi:unnamed protein product [Ixodes hexagonus]